MELDRSNGNILWRDALVKEMKNVGVAFEVLPEGSKATAGWKPVTGHLVWDIKIDFTRKVHWVKDGHRIPDPKSSNYAGIVSRESIRILLTHAAHNISTPWYVVSRHI